MIKIFTGIVAILVFTGLVGTASAALVIYTDRVAWEAAVLAVPLHHHSHSQDFNNEITGSLSAGENWFLPMIVTIPGTPGHNAIDDSFTPDPFSDALSPNGSKYYLGDVGVNASVAPLLTFVDLEYSIIAFGADWNVQGVLAMDVQGTFIPLPPGSSFLGVITDKQAGEFLTVNLLGSAVFGMDNVRIDVVPVPAGAWLFGSALLGLVAVKRKKS